RDARSAARSWSRASRTRPGVYSSSRSRRSLCVPGRAIDDPRALAKLAQQRGEQIWRHVEMIDLGQLGGQFARSQAQEDVRGQIAVDRDARLLHVGARLLDRAQTACLAVRRDLLGIARALRTMAGIGGLLPDQLAFTPRQLGLVVQLVFRDRPLFLNRQRAALENRLI